MAIEAINKNRTLLQQYKMELLVEDGQCSADMVMRTFIKYLHVPYFPQMAGILGKPNEQPFEEAKLSAVGRPLMYTFPKCYAPQTFFDVNFNY